jgi:hypothetical protein
MKSDRFLTVILVGIAVIIVAALALFFLRRETVEYGPEDTPAGVAQNYLLALYRQDYDRAYGYLSPRAKVTDAATFRQAIQLNEMSFRDTSVQPLETQINSDEAILYLQVTRGGGGLFSEPYRESSNALLERLDGEWRIYQMPYPFWSWDWYPNTPPDKPLP